jgi:two-component sensor histidine kinase
MPLVTEAAHGTHRRRNFPIAVHLALFVIGTLTPVLMIVTVMLIDAARLRRDDSLHDAKTAVRHLNATIEVEIRKAIAVAETLATSRALATGDYATFDGQARDVANRLKLVIVSRDLTGQQRTSTAAAPGEPLPVSNETILEVDRLAAQRKAPVVSGLVTGTVMNAPLVIADIPILTGPKVVGFIDVVLRPQRIGEILGQDLPEGWIAGVVGVDGRLIARSVEQDRYIGTINRRYLDAATDDEGTWSGITREGIAVTGAYVRSPLSGWIVSVAVPEAVLHAPALWALAWLGGLAAAGLAVSLWLGWRLSRRISGPIRDLVTRAQELGAGRRPGVSHSGVREVNAVADALVAASIELDRHADEAQRATEAVRANEERLQLVQDTAGIGTIDWDIETGRVVCSARFHELFSLPPDSPIRFEDIQARIHPAERERMNEVRARLFREGGPFEEEVRILIPGDPTGDGPTGNESERWIFARGRLELKDGRPARLLGANIDISERKRSEEHLRFLLREISHRSKNLLAVIQAMANQTAKSVETVDVFRRRFGDRLMGLAASHDLLVNQNWMGVSVGDLVRGQLASFVDENDRRILISGPDVDLKARSAEALGLALHELATNSLKYGALRDQTGRLEVVWTVYKSDDSESTMNGGRFRMDWIEHAADPIAPPGHKGFGRMVIEHTVEAALLGRVSLDFPPGGLRWRIDAPVSCLAPAGQSVAA